MIAEETAIAAAKLVGAAALGGVIAQRFMPPMTTRQWLLSVTLSLGLGVICGLAAAEYYHLPAGGGLQLLVTASSAIFGQSVIANAMIQIPEILIALRKRIIGEK